MSMRILGRCGTVLLIVMLISGCSWSGFWGSSAPDRGTPSGPGYSSGHTGECQNRNSCMHEGAYELGERGYAEQEAKRLNQASLERLLRSSRL